MRHWRIGVLALFLWLPLEDQVRKMTGNALGVYFVKDAIVVWLLLAVVRTRQSRAGIRMLPPALARALLFMLVVALLGCVNPRLPMPLAALLGLKVSFTYVLLLPVGYAFAQDEAQVRRLLRGILFSATVVAALGIYQVFFDASFLTPERSDLLAEAQLWDVRAGFLYVTSTFISPGRYVSYLLNAFGIGLAILLWDGRAGGRRSLYLGCVLIVALGLVTSGGRTGIVSLAVLVPAAAVLAARSAALGGAAGVGALVRRLLSAGLLLILTVTTLALLVPHVKQMIGFYWESLGQDGPAERAGLIVAQLAQRMGWREWMGGHGTGSASVGTQYLPGSLGVAVEGGYAVTIWEHGLLGLLAYVVLAAQLTRLALGRSVGASALGGALMAALGPLVGWQLWGVNVLAPVLQQYVAAIFLWFFVGVLIARRRGVAEGS